MKKQMINIFVLTLILGFFAIDMFGQNFTNNGGTYSTGSGTATLRMRASDGKFDGANPIGASTAIPGTVDWGAACSNAMNIGGVYSGSAYQPTYYTNLSTSGTAAKTYREDIFIANSYTPGLGATPGSRDYTTNTVKVTFNGTTGNQTIPGENSTNGTGFYDLSLANAATKSLATTGTTVLVKHSYQQDAASALLDTGTVTLDPATSIASASSGAINVIAGGKFNTGSGTFTTPVATGTITNAGEFNGGTGNISLAGVVTNTGTVQFSSGNVTSTANIDNNTTGVWNFGSGTFSNDQTFTNNTTNAGANGVFLGTGDGAATFKNFANNDGKFQAVSGTTINMNGSFTAAAVTTGNIDFACDANFNYTGTTIPIAILKNTAASPTFAQYGNLSITGTGKATAGGDVNVCNNLVVNQSAGVPANGNALDMATNNGVLTMLNISGTTTASYGTHDDYETFGKFRWNNPGTTEHVYNTNKTKVTFATAPAGGTNNNYFQLDVTPTVAPTQANDLVAADLIKRKIVSTFDNTTTTNGIISSLKVSWKASDESGYNTAHYNYLIFAEGISSSTPLQRLIRSGNNYTRVTGADPRNIDYAGGAGPGIALIAGAGGGTTRELSSGSEIILSSAPMDVISVQNGRWSDPNTWDIGQVPFANDNVHIRNVVWTGIDIAGAGNAGSIFGGTTIDADEVNGATAGDAGAAANRIFIDNGTTYPNSTLVIGNADATMGAAGTERLFRTRMDDNNNYIVNNNAVANTGNGDGSSASGLNGIWIRTVGSVFTPVLGTYTLTNTGSIQNNSILDIGICQ